MKRATNFFLILMLYCGSRAAAQGAMLLNKEFVDIKGIKGTTIFLNNTPDTLNFKYVFFNWLPYTETRDNLIIPPGEKDSITLTYNFPDFIEINNAFKVYNSPGKRLVCVVEGAKLASLEMTFEGDLASVNNYYAAYHKYIGGYTNESRAYYVTSEQLRDWNDFPAKADSITKLRLHFLENYSANLPNWFKKHESKRLLYNEYCRLSNALRSKEFYSGKKIAVNENYFRSGSFINVDDDMILNDTYVYCMSDYFADRAQGTSNTEGNASINAIDSLCHQTDIGDINLMLHLGRLYKQNKLMYNTYVQTLKFKDAGRKLWLDSLIQTRLKPTKLRSDLSKTAFTDVNGNQVSFGDYKGKLVVVNFWAVWCGPCKAEFPFENKLHNEYKDKGLIVVNVCFDSDRANWIRDSGKYNLQMVNLYSEKHDFERLMKEYNLTSLPASILIGRDGNITDGNLEQASTLLKNNSFSYLKVVDNGR